MVGRRRQCNIDYSPQAFWENAEYEYDRTIFSVKYAGRRDLFQGLAIWEEEKYRALQGTYPVISLSFANVKENGYEKVRYRVCNVR